MSHPSKLSNPRSFGSFLSLSLLLVAFTLSCTLALTGCTPPKSKAKALEDPLSPAAYPQIAALDGLGRIIAFSSPAISTTGDGELSVVVPVRLIESQTETKSIEYKFEFFNADGSPVIPPQKWQYMNLPANAHRYIKGHAKTTRTKDWRLLVREAKD